MGSAYFSRRYRPLYCEVRTCSQESKPHMGISLTKRPDAGASAHRFLPNRSRGSPACSTPLSDRMKKAARPKGPSAFLVPVAGVATPLTRLHAHVGENGPPDRFLPNRFAVLPPVRPPPFVLYKKIQPNLRFNCIFWCRWRGSNPHPVARTGF